MFKYEILEKLVTFIQFRRSLLYTWEVKASHSDVAVTQTFIIQIPTLWLLKTSPLNLSLQLKPSRDRRQGWWHRLLRLQQQDYLGLRSSYPWCGMDTIPRKKGTVNFLWTRPWSTIPSCNAQKGCLKLVFCKKKLILFWLLWCTMRI